jgi:hypothetical protein
VLKKRCWKRSSRTVANEEDTVTSYRHVLLLICAFAALTPPLAAQQPATFKASVSVPGTTVERVEGEVVLPSSGRVTSVVVFIFRGLSEHAFQSQQWRQSCARVHCALLHARIVGPERDPTPYPQQVVRNASLGGGRGLLALIDTLAIISDHAELRTAPLVFWGHSAAGNFGITFAVDYPQRTAAFIRHHSSMRGLGTDHNALKGIPALIVAGERDDVAGFQDSEQFWLAGRQLGAPWAYVLEEGVAHRTEPKQFDEALELQVAWVEGMLKHRLRGTGLKSISAGMGFIGDHDTAMYGRAASTAATPRSSWLPDEATARQWQVRARPFTNRSGQATR